jgi:hypothetical protein
MRQSLHKRLARLEQDVQACRASAKPESSDHIELIRGWLRAWGVEQQPEERMAETLSRALGIHPVELRDRLRRLACAQ